MKLSVAGKILIATYINSKFVHAKNSLIQDSYKDGCKNHVDFTASFKLDDGSMCEKCTYCDGTALIDFFDPKIQSSCIQCDNEVNACDSFSITTTFQSAWNMKLNAVRSSDKETKFDPKQVIIKGSNDNKVWEDLYITEAGSEVFTGRNEVKELVLTNDKEYQTYKIIFKIKESRKMHTGSYDIIKAYTRQCIADLHNEVTVSNLIPYDTIAPTSDPSIEPSSMPSSSSKVYEFKNYGELQTAVNLWISDKQEAVKIYGLIKEWDVSRITDMGGLFMGKSTFNEDLSQWDVSKVTSMAWTFFNAKEFNSDLSQWNTAKITNMIRMFHGATVFNSDLSQWNTAKVTAMAETFAATKEFNSDLSQWNTATVTTMYSMFHGARNFNANLSPWNIKNVERMDYMFYSAYEFSKTLCWDVSTATKTTDMFYRTKGGSADPNC